MIFLFDLHLHFLVYFKQRFLHRRCGWLLLGPFLRANRVRCRSTAVKFSHDPLKPRLLRIRSLKLRPNIQSSSPGVVLDHLCVGLKYHLLFLSKIQFPRIMTQLRINLRYFGHESVAEIDPLYFDLEMVFKHVGFYTLKL